MTTGSSTHNQKVEWLWHDTRRGIATLYYCLFYFLESQELLDPLKEVHVLALHYVDLPRINRALTIYRQGWNHRGIETAQHQSPHQLFVT